MSAINITDLAGAIYSSGKVFDGLTASRRDTENFLRSGSLAGIFSRPDLALLEDLRDVAQFIIDHHDQPIDAALTSAPSTLRSPAVAHCTLGSFEPTTSRSASAPATGGTHLPH